MKYKAPALVWFLQVFGFVLLAIGLGSLPFSLEYFTPTRLALSLAVALAGGLWLCISPFVDIVARAAFDVGRIAERLETREGNREAQFSTTRTTA